MAWRLAICGICEKYYECNGVPRDDINTCKNFISKIIESDKELPYQKYSPCITELLQKMENNEVRKYNIGTSNYSKMTLQPWDVWIAWHLNPWDADIVKRIARTKVTGAQTEYEARKEDYQKIIHDAQECIRQIDEGIYNR